MSIFSSIMNRIMGAAQQAAGPALQSALQGGDASATGQSSEAGATPATAGSPPPTPPSAVPPASQGTVDVEAVLSQMASQKGGGGNWRTSIVDLLKLLDLDSSLDARKGLGQELDVHAGADGSAEQNTALQVAVMRKLSENGGKVPADLKG